MGTERAVKDLSKQGNGPLRQRSGEDPDAAEHPEGGGGGPHGRFPEAGRRIHPQHEPRGRGGGAPGGPLLRGRDPRHDLRGRARGIPPRGGDTSATDFCCKTHDKLYAAFKPIVSEKVGEVGATRSYKDMMRATRAYR